MSNNQISLRAGAQKMDDTTKMMVLDIVWVHWMKEDIKARQREIRTRCIQRVETLYRSYQHTKIFRVIINMWYNNVFFLNDVDIIDYISCYGAYLATIRVVYGICKKCNTHVMRFINDNNHVFVRCCSQSCLYEKHMMPWYMYGVQP